MRYKVIKRLIRQFGYRLEDLEGLPNKTLRACLHLELSIIN